MSQFYLPWGELQPWLDEQRLLYASMTTDSCELLRLWYEVGTRMWVVELDERVMCRTAWPRIAAESFNILS